MGLLRIRVSSKIRLSPSSLIYASIILEITYAFLPLIRALPFFLRIIWRALPVLFLFAALAMGKKRRLITYAALIVFFGVFSGWQRSMVYANGMETSILSNCIVSVCYWSQLILGYSAIEYIDFYQAERIINFSKVLCVLSCVTTIIGNFVIPGITRASANFSETDFGFYIFNIGTYSFIYAIVFFVPTLLFLRRNGIEERNNRKINVVVLLIILCIVFSQFFAAFVLLFISLLAINCNRNLFLKIFLITLGAVFCILLLRSVTDYIIILCNRLSAVGMGQLAERLRGMVYLLKSNTTFGDVAARMHLYRVSWQHFLHNPFLGLIGRLGFNRAPQYTASEMLGMSVESIMAVGQHSDIIDLLGGSGLLGCFPFVFVMFRFLKRMIFHAETKRMKNLFIIILIQYIIYGFVDHAFSCLDVSIITFVMPAILLIVDREKAENAV